MKLWWCPPGHSMGDDVPPALCPPLGKAGFAAQAVSQQAPWLHLGIPSQLIRAEHNPTCSIQRLFREHLSASHVVLTLRTPTTAVSSPHGPHEKLQLHTNNIPANYEQTSSETPGPSQVSPEAPAS